MSLVTERLSLARWVWRSSILRLTMVLSVLFAIGMAVAIYLALDFGKAALIDRVDVTLAGLAQSIEVDDVPQNNGSIIVMPLEALSNLPKPFADVARRGGGTVQLDNDFRLSEDWRVLVGKDSEGEAVLIAVPLDDSEDALDLLGGVLWTTAIFVLVIAMLIGLVIGLLVQRRLHRIAGTLDRLGAGDLAARTGIARSRDDLDNLAHRLDMTAAELERLVVQTRHLSASIAHDLRTPLARLRARMDDLPVGQAREAVLEEADRLGEIFDTIMRIARIEAAQGSGGVAPVDLGALAQDLAETYTPVVEEQGKDLQLKIESAQTVSADKTMLIQALANLIQNAIVHGGHGITLFVDGAVIGVYDDGDGVDPTAFDKIVKPMVRLDAARKTEGSGLGLALVRAVAERHGASLVLKQHHPHGLHVAIKFTRL